ncbi:septation protein SepH [Georgenia sp. AZ-5]|uniref:septation protein SepH n=1 Tax=Georgenia sp. AZ-5 TaxID=3367526 RepID=UPI003754277B
MVELELLGLHGDGEHLTLSDVEGRRYRLPIDDALRAAVRRDRPGLEAMRAGEASLRPKDIQTLIRAGARVEEVAEQSGLSVEHVRRYEGPVLAERAWVVQQAQAQRLGHDSDAPRLGDLVVDRLAARGVPTATLQWDAVRRPGGPWEVLVTFVAGGREREARWHVDLSAHTLHAVDDESRWLSETEVGPTAHPRRHLTPVGARSRLQEDADAPGLPALPPAPRVLEQPDEAPTDRLLADLAAHRGTRAEVLPGPEDDDDDAPGPEAYGAHPAASRPEDATDAHVLALPRREPAARPDAGDGPEPGTAPALPADHAPAAAAPVENPAGATPAAPADAPAARPLKTEAQPRRRRTTRRSVPSWDEIVFGAKPE